MSTTLHQASTRTHSTDAERTTRVAIREIREAACRALVALGASPCDAKVASGQVVFDELHRGTGLAGLLEERSSGALGSDSDEVRA